MKFLKNYMKKYVEAKVPKYTEKNSGEERISAIKSLETKDLNEFAKSIFTWAQEQNLNPKEPKVNIKQKKAEINCLDGKATLLILLKETEFYIDFRIKDTFLDKSFDVWKRLSDKNTKKEGYVRGVYQLTYNKYND